MSKRLGYGIVGVLALGTVAILSLVLHSNRVARSETKTTPTPEAASPKVACLGRIEPKDGVVRISARSLSGQPSLVAELHVTEGDRVKTGQVLAVLDSRPQLEATVRDLEARVVVAQDRLALVKAGAKAADIAAQKAEVSRLEAELANAQTEFNRTQRLFESQATTASDRDKKRTTLEATKQLLGQAQSRLASLEEVRAVDVKLADAEVQAAQASVQAARAQLESSLVRAPFVGQVLKIEAHPGEEVGPKGILQIGKTDQMYVFTEVVESEVSRVQVGQHATITGDALKQPLYGKVDTIGLEVAKQDVLNTDPVSLSDARVVEVKVRLDDSVTAARLIHAKVTVLLGR